MTTTAPPSSLDLSHRVTVLEAEVAALKEQIERAEVLAAVKESTEQIARGESISLRDFDTKMRTKHSIPPR